jgi:hypothetical protein
MPAGALMAGVSSHWIGAPSTVAIMGGVVIVLAFLISWLVPRMRRIVV